MVTRHETTYSIHTRLGVITVSHLTPIEERTTLTVIRWDCRLTLTKDDITLVDDFKVVPYGAFKPLTQYTKLDVQRVIEELARSSQTEHFLTRFEAAYAQIPNPTFHLSTLPD